MDAFLKSYLGSRGRAIEKALARVVPQKAPRRLAASMRYSLLAGGKRIRPLLLVASAEACGLSSVRGPASRLRL